MIHRHAAAAFAASILVVSACQSMGGDYDRPARIVHPDDASRAALRATINGVLRTEVALADTALTDSSLLTIARDPPRTMQNPDPQGRVMEMPFQFRLVINGSDCILIDQRDRSRHTLADTICEAE